MDPYLRAHSEGELWGLGVHPTEPKAITASDDKSVRIWDLENHVTESVAYIDTEARSCAFSTDGAVLAVGTKDGAVLILSAEDLSEISRIQDRKQARHCCAFSPDGEFLAVGSNDNRVDIYSVSGDYEKVGCGSKASSFITQLDWSAESDYIAACDGAGERLVYDTSGSHITDSVLGSENFYNLFYSRIFYSTSFSTIEIFRDFFRNLRNSGLRNLRGSRLFLNGDFFLGIRDFRNLRGSRFFEYGIFFLRDSRLFLFPDFTPRIRDFYFRNLEKNHL